LVFVFIVGTTVSVVAVIAAIAAAVFVVVFGDPHLLAGLARIASGIFGFLRLIVGPGLIHLIFFVSHRDLTP
jgi:hypothetical protein